MYVFVDPQNICLHPKMIKIRHVEAKICIIQIHYNCRGGHFGFSPLENFAHIFSRYIVAHFNQHPQIVQNQPSNLGSENTVTGPYCRDSTSKGS